MTDFASRLTRLPHAFEADAAATLRAAFADIPADLRELLAGTAGCSPYLRALMLREGEWLRGALTMPPESCLAGVLEEITAQTADLLARQLRLAKGRVGLLTALADLGGVWPLEAVTGALTAFADRAVTMGVHVLVGDEIRRGKLPGAVPDDATTGAGMVVFAMGKMGAGELNYSSDIDLICLFDQDRYGDDAPDARAAFVRVTRRLAALLGDVTANGYVFRVDLRLRPDAAVTPVCLSMAAAEAYYESVGRTWERAAFIKARPCAGDLVAGERFLKALIPFVWRRHLDFAAIQDAHDMRLRIKDHRRLHGPLTVEGHNMKLGTGGIREIEFFTQTRQLIAGGRDPDLRGRTTVGGLAALAAKGWVPQTVAQDLTALYRAHREVEHRLQMVGDAQTHDLPGTADGVARIAAFCGQDAATFRAGLLYRLARTDALTDGFFVPPAVAAGPELTDKARAIVQGWKSYPALRSERAQQIFRRLAPGLLSRLNRSANPDEALMALDGFLAGLPAGVQIFALFDANPSLVDLIIDIAATSPALARYLSRNAGVFDAVIGGAFFVPWPGEAALTAELGKQLTDSADYEALLGAARRWQKEWHFRIGVHHLRGLIDAAKAGQQYAELAGAVLAALWPPVVRAFAQRHGPPPGRGAVLLGMGSLGAGRLNARSDLDLIVIYDALEAETSIGPRPLGTRAYYARLTQALVTALVAPMAEGRLYEVDMRLRPSGRQGPVATSFGSFVTYQNTEAWTWEHMALTRARVMAGSSDLSAEIEQVRQRVIAEKGRGATVRNDVNEMRARVSAARPGTGGLDAKSGPGRLMEIELCAQMLALLAGSPERSIEEQLSLAGADATELIAAYRLFWTIQAATRLLTDRTPAADALGTGGWAFLLRETGMKSQAALMSALDGAAGLAEAAFSAQLEPQDREKRMDLETADPKGLIRESYRIDGITAGECRSVFMDWALSLPVGASFKDALTHLMTVYEVPEPDHPMSAVLRDGMSMPEAEARRKGGRAARVPATD